MRAYLGALKGSATNAGPLPELPKDEKPPEAMATEDLVAEAMAGGDDEWEDVDDDWEDA